MAFTIPAAWQYLHDSGGVAGSPRPVSPNEPILAGDLAHTPTPLGHSFEALIDNDRRVRASRTRLLYSFTAYPTKEPADSGGGAITVVENIPIRLNPNTSGVVTVIFRGVDGKLTATITDSAANTDTIAPVNDSVGDWQTKESDSTTTNAINGDETIWLKLAWERTIGAGTATLSTVRVYESDLTSL